MPAVTPIRMPKWGMSMQEGVIVEWRKAVGDTVAEGDELVDIETAKITNVCESPTTGVLRRITAVPGETLAVGALIGAVADASVGEAELDAFVAEFQSAFVPGAEDEGAADALVLQTVETAHGPIRVGRTAGEAVTPVVLLHGFASDLNSWLFNTGALAAGGPVIAIDLPGHGGSTKDVGDGSLARLAQTVTLALDALGVERTHLVGHSLGGAVAARVAADHPARVASLSLICAPGLPGTEVSGAFLTGVVEARRARDMKPWLERLTADPALITRDMVDDVIKAKRLDGAEEALGALRDRMVDGADLRALQDDMGRIASALVITTPRDRIVGEPDATALPPHLRLVVVEGAGHMPQMEQAGEVNRLLLERIDRG